MSAAELLEKAKALPIQERAELASRLCENLAEEGYDPGADLTAEQVAELDKRAERALSSPKLCRPLDDVLNDIEERSQTSK
jgi:putative addiction module component (TIGR02574 family)